MLKLLVALSIICSMSAMACDGDKSKTKDKKPDSERSI
jgi:hypothetical protein